MNEPVKILEELSIILAGLKMNIFKKEQIVEFLDGLIKNEDSPDYLFIDITLSSQNKNEIIDKLSSFISLNRNQINTEKLLSIVYILFGKKLLSLKNTMILLYKLNNEFDFGEAQNTIHRLDDKYHLISTKHVEQTIDQLGIETLDFLSKYEDESLSLIFLNKKTTNNYN